MTLEFTLIETHYGDLDPGHRIRARRQLSDMALVEAILRMALAELTMWGFYLHHIHTSDEVTEWVVTVVAAEHDEQKWFDIVQDPIFEPKINAAWCEPFTRIEQNRTFLVISTHMTRACARSRHTRARIYHHTWT